MQKLTNIPEEAVFEAASRILQERDRNGRNLTKADAKEVAGIMREAAEVIDPDPTPAGSTPTIPASLPPASPVVASLMLPTFHFRSSTTRRPSCSRRSMPRPPTTGANRKQRPPPPGFPRSKKSPRPAVICSTERIP